jgi:hypothetical protein
MGERTFDYSGLVDELRCHTTEWLEAARVEAVREQRRWRVRELAIMRVLDERGRIDDSLAGADGVSVRDVRETRETARLLDELPQIAKAAHRGELSHHQLSAVVRLADPDDDGEWAQRGRNCSPEDLDRLVRRTRTPNAEDGRKRREARTLGFWWRKDDAGMLDGRVSLPDVDGALLPKVVRGVRLRDAQCRWPGCDRRTGLQVHHLWPVSWGGDDDQSNLALVCVGRGTDHHGLLAPNGKHLLLGNPNCPDGLHLIRVDQLAALADLAADQARTKSEAA